MTEASKKPTSNTKAPDLRLLCFYRFLGVGLLGSILQSIVRTSQDPHGLGIDEFLRQAELYSWTPGLFWPNELNLFLNWGLLIALSIYLIVGKVNKVGLLLVLAIAISHFFARPIRVSNHYLVALWALSVLAFVPYKMVKEGNRDTTPLAIELLKHLCLLTYIFAVLHKLNSGYFSPELTSLQSAFPTGALKVFELLGIEVNEAFRFKVFTVLIPISIVMELLIPLFLMFKRTRLMGWICGIIFHWLITYLSGIIDYSLIIISFYVLFLSEQDLTTFIDRLKLRARLKLILSLAFTILVESLPILMGTESQHWPDNASAIIWIVKLLTEYAITFAAFYCLYSIGEWMFTNRTTAPFSDLDKTSGLRTVMKQSRQMLLMVIIMDSLYLINCLCPYLGAKFYHSQTMFSDLKVDTETNNHWFMPYLEVFNNNAYIKVLDLEFSPSADKQTLANNRGLEFLLNNYKHALVERNFLFCVLQHAAIEGNLKASITYANETTPNDHIRWDDVSQHLEEMPVHLFNLYPWLKKEI